MLRKGSLAIAAAAALSGGLASTALAGSPIALRLSEGAAFAILGHSCGGIQQQDYVAGFGADGHPTGNVSLSTSCGGSGRGGGYKTTKYTGSASVVWSWFGETVSYTSPAQGPFEAVPAEDGHGDRVYNIGTTAYLELGEPPLEPPAAPTNVSAGVSLAEAGESEFLRLNVSWTVDPDKASEITSSTVTATPVGSSAPTLTSTVSSYFSNAALQPAEPDTTYVITLTSTDAEGTSAASTPIELTTPNSDGEGGHEGGQTEEGCESARGTIRLSPGLTETPHAQNVTIKGELVGCDGPLPFESARFKDHLRTTEEVTCSELSSLSSEPTTEPLSLAVKWLPKEPGVGASKGTIVVPISEVFGATLTGTLEGGPLEAPAAISAASLSESFSGGASCGASPGPKKKARPVKQGSFTSSEVEIGGS